MSHRNNRTMVAAITVLAVFSLLSCSSETPATPASSTPSIATETPADSSLNPTETPTSDPTVPSGPPEKPAAMANNNEEGALAAAEYFLDASAYAVLMGDEILMEDFSTDTCIFCSNVVESIKNDRKTQVKRLTMSFTFNEQPSIEHKHGIWVIEGTITLKGSHEQHGKKIIGETETADVQIYVYYKNGGWKFERLFFQN
ncbi:hypothetical protein Jden_1147 [Jonesia denitrificans DSM 20603]|uniref:DUF6318 domain-containing protein n=2 Tax=Jonesia TaxID=43673 RepID=C7R3U6_JONDD|nr:hypothetical protein Jden_1147 [Jonesia denitrificans DSM 20603]SQH20792.1 Uncharacterised protein [Jonesia denitrificans]